MGSNRWSGESNGSGRDVATSGPRRPGAAAPARAGGSAARSSPADGSPPAGDRLSRRTPARTRPSRRGLSPAHRGPRSPRQRRSPCRVPLVPTTCTACPSRSTPPVARRAARRVQRQADGRGPRRLPVLDLAGPTDGSAPARQVTIGSRADRRPRFSPDGRTLAFISDRRLLVEEEPDRPKEAKDRLDCDQLFLLPLDGGEARRLTDLPRGVNDVAWSPDGRSLAVLRARAARRWPRTPAAGAARRSPSPARRRCRITATSTGWRTSTTASASSTTTTRTCGSSTPRRARRDRWSPGRRPRAARLEPRRHPHRVHRQPPAAAGPRRSLVGVRRGRRVARGDHDRRRRRHAVRRAHLDAGRRLDPRHRRAVPSRRLPDRDLGLRGGRLGRRPGWRHGPARRERAEARRGPQQRRDAGRGHARHPGGGRRDGPVHGTGRRLVRAVAGGAPRRRGAGPADGRSPLPVRLGRGGRPGIATWSWRSTPMPRRCPRSWRSRRARRRAARRRRER